VPFEGWEAMIFHGGPIVWASSQYEKTGVVPYVHDEGARTSSLRRLYKKRPYFTNGSAPDLETALRAVRFDPFSHAGADAGKRLSDAEIASLRAFLDLL
jgi:cytochrome c peroxidase